MARNNQSLNGYNPLAYVGVNATQPPNLNLIARDPTTNDSRNVFEGDFWLNTSVLAGVPNNGLWYLANLSYGNATWLKLSGGSSGPFLGLVGNDMVVVNAVPATGYINVVGDGTTITTTGNNTTHTLTISAINTGVVENVQGDDSVIVTPVAGTITFSGGSTGLLFNADLNEETLTGVLAVAHGGTGANTLTGILTGNGASPVTANAVTQHGILIGGASNAASSLGVATNGQLPIGSTGANPVLATLTAGTGITITNGAGSISVASNGPSTYTTGTFTPTLTFGGLSVGITYSSQTGMYTQIGNIVYVTMSFMLSSKGSSTGDAAINGLPFTVSSAFASAAYMDLNVTLGQGVTLDAGYTGLHVLCTRGTTTGTFIEDGSAEANFTITNSYFSNTASVTIFGTYFI